MTDPVETIEARLKALDITLPEATAPVANYVPVVGVEGPLLYVSGQLPIVDGRPLVTGLLGEHVPVEAGYNAARVCALNILAQVKAALEGDLEWIERCVKLTGFVAATPAFVEHPKVINGASDLMVEVLGPRGHHTRSAVGVASLPLGAAVEVEAIFLAKSPE
ncbi:MAG: RidA family protein [Pseudomonadota bacterium]